jgi:hypothetical protein
LLAHHVLFNAHTFSSLNRLCEFTLLT